LKRKQLIRSLDWTTKKLKCAEMKEATTAKKLTAAKAQCIVLAKLAQERRKEGRLAACKIKTAQRIADDAVSNATKELLLQQEEFNIVVNDMKSEFRSKLKSNEKNHTISTTKELLLQQEEFNIVVNDRKSEFRSKLKSNEKNHV